MTAGAAVLVDSTGACTPLPSNASSQDVLAQRANGAYTTASVVEQFKVVDWRLHVQRLVRNMRCLHLERPPSFQHFMAWLDSQDKLPEDIVMQLVQPHAALALAELAKQLGPGPKASEGQVLLNIVLQDGTTDQATSTVPLQTAVFCKTVPATPPDQVVQAMVHGAPRRWAHAKHCQWVLDRRTLEATKPPGVAEVLLASPEGGIVEGLVSNFYVIAGGSRSHGSPAGAHSVLMTNGPDEPALQGITQARILQAAARIGLPVQLAAPRLNDRHTWQEAIISNCIKGMQPVGKIIKPPNDAENEGGWELQLPQQYGPITQQLQAAVKELQELSDARKWL